MPCSVPSQPRRAGTGSSPALAQTGPLRHIRPMAKAKICGLSTPEAVQAALDGGAAYIGFVFFARSPRDIAPEAAARLAEPARGKAGIVAVTVDPDDALLDRLMATLKPDVIQLHGNETPARVAEIG